MSRNPQRYHWAGNGVVKDPNGEYVSHRSYQALLLELETLEERAALAPAAVVMPERANTYIGDRENQAWAAGHNYAMDAVARLNRRAIPEGLLERLQHYVNHCDFSEQEWNGERELLQDELRALLDSDMDGQSF